MVSLNKFSFALVIVLLCASCKKENTDLTPKIIKESVVSIRDREISLTYEISSLGYSKSGIKYYKKGKPEEAKTIEAVRKDGVFHVVIEHTEPQSTYIIQPYVEYKGQMVFSESNKEVTTTAAFPDEFSLNWSNTDVFYDEFRKFTTTVEGKNLNNINLHDLAILLGSDTLKMDYPKLINKENYQINVTGTFTLPAGNYMLRVLYKGQEIMGQAIDFSYKGDALTLQLKATHFRNWYASIGNDQVYYFINNIVSVFDPETSRLSKIMDIPYQMRSIPSTSVTLGNKIFFKAQPLSLDGYELFSQSYDVSTEKFTAYYFSKSQTRENTGYEHTHLFVHNDNIYHAYTHSEDINGKKKNTTNEVVKFDKKSEKFEHFATFDPNFKHYEFISIAGKLYAFGQTNVLDQGFYIGSTFIIYAVDPTTFKLTELYRYGNKNETYPYSPAGLLNYNGNILACMGLNNFILYEIKTNTLKPIIVPQTLPHEYYGGMFIYKNKHYLNANLQFTDGTVYEMSIQ